ncbi:MAG: MFS transporter [Steroidobacteraceae bacterium]|jgi:MFS family permease
MRAAGRLGPIWLADDVTRGNALAFLYAAFFSVCLLSFLSFMQPFVLDAHLGIPRSQQGRATFLLGTAQEIAMLLLVGPFGALADKLGRRVLYTLGLAWVGVGYILYPLADSLPQLVATRFFFAVGAAMIGTAMATVLADTPRDRSRGLLVAATGVLQGLGVMFGVLVLSKLPLRFESLGHSDDMAGRYTLWIGAALCFVTAAVCWLGLHRGTPGDTAHRRESLLQLLGIGVRTARANRRLALGYSIIGLSHDPFAPGMMLKMILLGAGELSCILAVQALLGQQAPGNLRGSVMGIAAFTSALGVLFATSLGGWLFDHWRAGGPFVMIAIVNALVMLAALWVRFTTPTERPAA